MSTHLKPILRGTTFGAALLLTVLAGAAQAATLQITVLAKDGQPMPDAVVIVEPANPGKSAVAPAPVQVEIQQLKLQFVPKVSVIPLGSKVLFSNLDSYDHHVRGLPAGLGSLNAAPDRGFTLTLPGKVDNKPASSATETLKDAGPMQLGCHLHASMRGSIYVSDTPWVVKTDAEGKATVQNLPEGSAKVRLWFAEQLVESPATEVSITPTTSVTIPTNMTRRRQRL